MATKTTTTSRSVETTIGYYASPDGPNGIYPGTAGYQRRVLDPKIVQVTDMRGSENTFDLDKNGFQVVKHRWAEIDVNDPDQRIKEVMYPEIVEVLKELTGATDAVPFSYQIRSHSTEEVKAMANGLENSNVLKAVGPTRFAHTDNSERGSLPVLKENIPASEFKKRQKSRWAITNIWRPIGRPVTRDNLALLDSHTVEKDDFVPLPVVFPRAGEGAFDNFYNPSEGFETAQIRAADKHRWYYVSSLTPDETLVFKQYDSKTDGRARQVPHCAFQCKDDYGPPRQSIEARCLLFWEGESVE